MDDKQVAAAKARAAEMVNGFKRVTEQAARDVIKLADTIEFKNRQIDALKRKLLAEELLRAANKGKRENPYSEFFKNFGL